MTDLLPKESRAILSEPMQRPTEKPCSLCHETMTIPARGRVRDTHDECAQVQYALNDLWTAVSRAVDGASNEKRQAIRKLIASQTFSRTNATFNKGKKNA